MEASKPPIRMRTSEPEPNSSAPKVLLSDRKSDRKIVMPPEDSTGLETTGRVTSPDSSIAKTSTQQAADQSQSGAKRRTQSSTQQRTRMTIKQRWVGKQQHLAEQVQQLKEQAEYINQQLAAKHSRRSHPESLPAKVQPALDGDTANLEGQLERVMRLLTELETALAAGGAIAGEPNPPVIAPSPVTDAVATPSIASPQANAGTQDDTDEEIVAALRQMKASQPAATVKQSRSRVQPVAAPSAQSVAKPHRRKSWLHQVLRLPHRPIAKIGDATLWIVFSALLRTGFNSLLTAFPMLSPVAIVLLLAPAAVAIYLTLCVPKAGLLPIYRLFLVMLGFLLGGRF